MSNDISLTVRLPENLNYQITQLSNNLGLTKVNLLRFAIWHFLDANPQKLNFDMVGDNTFRLKFDINQATYNILNNACDDYNKSMNSIIIAVATLALERYSKYL